MPASPQRSSTPQTPADAKPAVRFVHLWNGGHGPAFPIKSAFPAEVTRLEREAWAVRLPGVVNDVKVLFANPPYIDARSFAGKYGSPSEFEQRYLAACPLLSAISSTLKQSENAPGSQAPRVSFADMVDGAGPRIFEQDRPYPRRFSAAREIEAFPDLYTPTMRARRKFLELLRDWVTDRRRRAIEDLHRTRQIVAKICDDQGAIVEFRVGHWLKPSTELAGDKIWILDSSGARRAFEIISLELRDAVGASSPADDVATAPAPAVPQLDRNDRWTAKSLVIHFLDHVRPVLQGKSDGNLVREMRAHASYTELAQSFDERGLRKEFKELAPRKRKPEAASRRLAASGSGKVIRTEFDVP
jgi:hypothetical protein